jgi:hypothetical protein
MSVVLRFRVLHAAAAFGSKTTYLFGRIGMGIKLVPGYSAGTVTAYYVKNIFFSPLPPTSHSKFKRRPVACH